MKPLLSILVIAISIGVYFVYIKPLTIDIKVQIAKKNEIEKVLNRVKEIKERRDAIFDEYNSIPQEDIEKLNKILPEKINSVVVLNDLSYIAAQYGFTVKEYKADDLTNDRTAVDENVGVDPYKKTKLTLKLSGPYGQFVEFLNKLESSLMLMDVVSLNIKQGGVSQGPSTPLEYLLEINIYSLK